MKILIGDTETTGVKVTDGDRIIEIALSLYDLETESLIRSYTQRINPECAINPKAQAVHGISSADLIGQPVFADVAEEIYNIIQEADVFVAHNVGFDVPFIASELVASGFHLPELECFCTLENGRWATFNGKSPKLKELCATLGIHYDDAEAHAADYDVSVTASCLFAGIKRGFFNLNV